MRQIVEAIKSRFFPPSQVKADLAIDKIVPREIKFRMGGENKVSGVRDFCLRCNKLGWVE